mmetsp:Transcript_27455/g.38167  ORF Transcript_27455/g.38167 Transcript_27455/m.38167 type:complete len:90 (-) Transcript_27455:5-274(-)
MENDIKREQQQREYVVSLTKIMLHYNLPTLWRINSRRFERELSRFIEDQASREENVVEEIRKILEFTQGFRRATPSSLRLCASDAPEEL